MRMVMYGCINKRNKLSYNRIKRLNLCYGWKLEDLAERVGISAAMLSYIEHVIRLPKVIIAPDIAVALHTTVKQFWRRNI